MEPADLLDPDKIRENLNTDFIGKKVIVYDSVASTNDIAAEYSKNPASNGLVILAKQQTSGRGRAGNKWISSKNKSILCSIVLTEIKINPEFLSMTIAVAVAKTIGVAGRNRAAIKWPNDIFIDTKKIAGILIESKACPAHNAFILGIGINCHQKPEDFPQDLTDSATSLDMETDSVCDRVTVIKRLFTILEHCLETAGKSPEKITQQWKDLNNQLGRPIRLSMDRETFSGSCSGIDPQKGLIVTLGTGQIRFFPSRHCSILK